ncbi:MAG: hypothetical protein LBR87_03410 [Synergistaceae bacterium]|nr:hypothetical protein [Synergistaceae bacterium]
MDKIFLSARCFFVKNYKKEGCSQVCGERSVRFIRVRRLGDILIPRVRELVTSSRGGASDGFIYFRGIYGDGVAPQNGKPAAHWREYSEICSFLGGMKLFPFAKLDISLAGDGGDEQFKDRAPDRLKSFINMAVEYGMKRYWEKGRFEVSGGVSAGNVAFMETYAAIRSILKDFSGGVEVGFRCGVGSGGLDLDLLEENLIVCRHTGCEPDFVTMTAPPAGPGCPEGGGGLAAEAMNVIADSGARVGKLYIADGEFGTRVCGSVDPSGVSGDFGVFPGENGSAPAAQPRFHEIPILNQMNHYANRRSNESGGLCHFAPGPSTRSSIAPLSPRRPR